MLVRVPTEQAAVSEGAVEAYFPSLEPQTPFTDLLTVHVPLVVPPLAPVQDQVQGPVPEIAVAVPVVQRLVVGAMYALEPFEVPQAPLTGVLFREAEHVAVEPEFNPTQDQLVVPPLSGKAGVVGFTVPREQKVSEPYDVSE
jgi:hypothetical protein